MRAIIKRSCQFFEFLLVFSILIIPLILDYLQIEAKKLMLIYGCLFAVPFAYKFFRHLHKLKRTIHESSSTNNDYISRNELDYTETKKRIIKIILKCRDWEKISRNWPFEFSFENIDIRFDHNSELVRFRIEGYLSTSSLVFCQSIFTENEFSNQVGENILTKDIIMGKFKARIVRLHKEKSLYFLIIYKKVFVKKILSDLIVLKSLNKNHEELILVLIPFKMESIIISVAAIHNNNNFPLFIARSKYSQKLLNILKSIESINIYSLISFFD